MIHKEYKNEFIVHNVQCFQIYFSYVVFCQISFWTNTRNIKLIYFIMTRLILLTKKKVKKYIIRNLANFYIIGFDTMHILVSIH